MTNRELAAALRLCGTVRGPGDCQKCPFSNILDGTLCVPEMTAACADALENTTTHVAVLQREIEKLRAQLEMAQKPQWVSVNERLPELSEEDNEQIQRLGILFAPEYVAVIKFATKATVLMFTGSDWIDDDGTPYDVTHWMPLPSAEEVE